MADLYLFNSLTRKKEKFVPVKPSNVGLYTCGMTVYDYAHIGHGRKYVADDILKRTLEVMGYKVKHVQNVTDVGHLVSDADEGEDKLEKGAKKEGKTVWEVAEYFTQHFYASMDKLNILRPEIVCRATEHIDEQIELVKKLMAKGFAYETAEAVYFDLAKFPQYSGLFGQRLEEKKVAARAEIKEGEHKKNPYDFALWFKRVGRFANHVMFWPSPWGDGFPGWHLECSAMSMKYLGQTFDIHTGGEDHLSIHHPNEIVQSEAATGKSPFVKYWLHTAFLMVDGRKMSKSLGNFYTIEDIEAKGFDPLALRYLFLTAHYRDPLNFTWKSLESAQIAWENLRKIVSVLPKGKLQGGSEYKEKFTQALGDDLNTPRALAVLWEIIKSGISDAEKHLLAMEFDKVLGLNLDQAPQELPMSSEIKKLTGQREKLRKLGKFTQADKIRRRITQLGYKIEDKPAHETE